MTSPPSWVPVSCRGFVLLMVLATVPASAQLTDMTQTPNAANSGIRKSLRAADRCGAGQSHHARFVAIHHRSRSVQGDSARPPAVPAQVHGRAGPRSPDQRRRRQHRDRCLSRSRTLRQLRRLPRKAAGRRGIRRRRLHATRQPRRTPPLRARPPGDARGRDDQRPAPDPEHGDLAGAEPRSSRHAEAAEQRHLVRVHHRAAERHGADSRHPGRRSGSPCEALLRAWDDRSRSGTSSSARSRTRWGFRHRTLICWPRPRARGRHPVGDDSRRLEGRDRRAACQQPHRRS